MFEEVRLDCTGSNSSLDCDHMVDVFIHSAKDTHSIAYQVLQCRQGSQMGRGIQLLQQGRVLQGLLGGHQVQRVLQSDSNVF